MYKTSAGSMKFHIHSEFLEKPDPTKIAHSNTRTETSPNPIPKTNQSRLDPTAIWNYFSDEPVSVPCPAPAQANQYEWLHLHPKLS